MPAIKNDIQMYSPLRSMASWLMVHLTCSLESQANTLRVVPLMVPCMLLRATILIPVTTMVTMHEPVVLPPHLDWNRQPNAATFGLPTLLSRLRSAPPMTTIRLLRTKTLQSIARILPLSSYAKEFSTVDNAMRSMSSTNVLSFQT